MDEGRVGVDKIELFTVGRNSIDGRSDAAKTGVVHSLHQGM